MNARLHRPLVALASISVVTACGGAPAPGPEGEDGGGSGREDSQLAQAATQVYDRYNGMSGQERTDELVACAEEEGQLNVYTSNSDMDDVVDAFTDEYDVDVSVYRAGGETVTQRIVQEDAAGYYGADVLENDGLELAIAEQEGLLHPYESALREGVRDEARVSDAWTGTRFNAFVVGWNTDRVGPDEVPTSFEDLAEPQWEGRISMELGDVDWFTTLRDHYVDEQGWTEEEYLDLMTRIAANSQVVKGHTTQGELLSAGQFDVIVSSYSHTIDGAAEDGAPVAWRPESGEPVQPIVVRPNGVALLKTATNPCAATLFADFQLTGAQQVFLDNFRIGANTGAEDTLVGLETLAVPMQKMIDESAAWTQLYADVVANGQELE